MLFSISSGCEERDLDKKAVSRYSLVEIASDAPPGEELVYSKVEKRSRENGEILDSSVVGSINNQSYQRAARPYTYLGSQEPFIYRDESETATDEDGNTIYIYKIFRQPNLHPVDPVPVYAPPAVSERLQALIDEKVSAGQTQNETVEVEIKLRNVPEYNIPLLPHPSEPIILNNRCVYLKIHKDHITPQGVTAHWFCYYAGVMDNAN